MRKVDMNLGRLFSRHAMISSKLNRRIPSSYTSGHRYASMSTVSTYPFFPFPEADRASSFVHGPMALKFKPFCRYIHTFQQVNLEGSSSGTECESESDTATNEFLSRFVWIMRKRLSEAYPGSDKNTIDGMLLIIVEKVVSEMENGGLERMTRPGASMPSEDFSEDLWRTVWEISNVVLQDMEKEKKKEKMKSFLQSEDVKEMYRFAGEVGIRGDMLRELRFKWAREKMEESEFYQSFERLAESESEKEAQEKQQSSKESIAAEEEGGNDGNLGKDKEKLVSLPKRHGRIKYKIYGLDLSSPKWAEVAEKIQESDQIIWPQEPKPVSGKSKLITEKILSLQEGDDPAPLIREWIDHLDPNRIDWTSFLERLEEQNSALYLKVAEFLLDEGSFQATVRDYSKLIEAHAGENRLEDAERILKKMNDNGIQPDVITSLNVVHMYCKSGNLDRAKEAFESLRTYGFQPDMKVYNYMIMAYVNAGQPRLGESLMREMEARAIKPTRDIYMALMRSFAERGDSVATQRISTTMQFAGFQPDLEIFTLMIEAYGQANDPDQAKNNFDYMIKLGHKPDDRCVASMIAAYERKNLLDMALQILLDLEKDGFEPGVSTYTVLVDWFGKLQLIDEAEQILDKIAEQGEAPPFKLHISLCDMYARAGSEKKALQALGVLESKVDQLGPKDFERIIDSLMAGGFEQDARRMQGLMEARGFVVSDQLKMTMMASQAIRRSNRSSLSWLRRER